MDRLAHGKRNRLEDTTFIVVLERGRQRNLADYVAGMDELDYAVRGRMYQDYSHETVTFRHSTDGKALPVRQIGSFKPGTGVGGAGEHWGGVCERMLPDAFEFLSRTTEKYGAKKLPEEHAILDWGITYDELEPYYSRAEVLLGASGKAGNIRGNKIEGGNVFEGWRSAEFPTPPTRSPTTRPYFATPSNRSDITHTRPPPLPSACRTQIPTGFQEQAAHIVGIARGSAA